MEYLSEILGRRGGFSTLCILEGQTKTNLQLGELLQLMQAIEVDEPQLFVEHLVASGILHGSEETYYLSSFGLRTTLLLKAVNGSDLLEVFRKLATIEPSLGTYELVREGLTELFIRSLVDRPGLGRLYFCSPWINLSRKEAEMLQSAVQRARKKSNNQLEILVLTRPEPGTSNMPPSGARIFQDLGADLFLHPRLHTKLYIREPDITGGFVMGIVGSENLTQSRYLELGIKINSDSRLIGQLIRYFFDLSNLCEEA